VNWPSGDTAWLPVRLFVAAELVDGEGEWRGVAMFGEGERSRRSAGTGGEANRRLEKLLLGDAVLVDLRAHQPSDPRPPSRNRRTPFAPNSGGHSSVRENGQRRFPASVLFHGIICLAAAARGRKALYNSVTGSEFGIGIFFPPVNSELA
jgi:hypothetical protein